MVIPLTGFSKPIPNMTTSQPMITQRPVVTSSAPAMPAAPSNAAPAQVLPTRYGAPNSQAQTLALLGAGTPYTQNQQS